MTADSLQGQPGADVLATVRATVTEFCERTGMTLPTAQSYAHFAVLAVDSEYFGKFYYPERTN
jgi:hypothetical protein